MLGYIEIFYTEKLCTTSAENEYLKRPLYAQCFTADEIVGNGSLQVASYHLEEATRQRAINENRNKVLCSQRDATQV